MTTLQCVGVAVAVVGFGSVISLIKFESDRRKSIVREIIKNIRSRKKTINL